MNNTSKITVFALAAIFVFVGIKGNATAQSLLSGEHDWMGHEINGVAIVTEPNALCIAKDKSLFECAPMFEPSNDFETFHDFYNPIGGVNECYGYECGSPVEYYNSETDCYAWECSHPSTPKYEVAEPFSYAE